MRSGFLTKSYNCGVILQRHFLNSSSKIVRNMSVKVGDSIPNVDLFENSPGTVVSSGDLCNGKKVLIFAVPGAFTPGCSKTHLPGYIAKAEEIKGKGVHEIVCVSVNDPFVMAAWGKEHAADGKVRMLADTNGKLTEAMGLGQDLAVLGGMRSKRYSAVVDNGTITHLSVEPDGTGLTCSLAENMVSAI